MKKFWWPSPAAQSSDSGALSLVSADGSVKVTLLGKGDDASTADAVLRAYCKDGRVASPAQMPQAGYVIEDSRRGRTLAIAAPVGVRQVFWSTTSGQLRLASEPALLAVRDAGDGPSPDSLYQYVYFHFLPGPASIHPDVAKLDGGHVLEWDGRTARIERYWHPSFAPDASLTIDSACAELRRILDAAVRRGLRRGARCGAFLSGGLDSSTVAGIAAGAQPGIPTVSMGFDAEGYDEMRYARIASSHFGTRPLEYYVTPEDVVRSLPDVAAAFPEPFGNSSAAAAYHCARIAREQGLDTLLAGDGGDELFGGNERYASQMVFERYARVPGVLRALLEPAVGAASMLTTRFPVGKARSYIRQAKTPLPDRLQEYNFLHRIAPEKVFNADLLRAVDREAPLRALREEYNVPTNADSINRMLFLDWKFTLRDNDLVKVNTMCELAGVKVAYPMLDPELVEFSLRLPSDWKVHGGHLRWLYKRAMADFLPREIIDKTKHGFGLPFGAWTRTHPGLQQMTADALSSLAQRRYFRPDFIAEAQRLHREGHASYFGELVWILMVLELWLRKHAPRAGL